MDRTFPMKPGDWVVDGAETVARVIRVYADPIDKKDTLIDISIYSRNGDRVGRTSPACGGPKSFEPACSASGWTRIGKPSFPIAMKWVPNGDGTSTPRYWAGERLPALEWSPKPKKASKVAIPDQPVPIIIFTEEEIRHLRDLLGDANHPLSIAIGQKAAEQVARIERLKEHT